MKINYLVGATRPVHTTWGHWKNQEDEITALEASKRYDDMYSISRASARKFLVGEWEEKKFTAAVFDVRLYQIAQWYAIKDLWHSTPCNILAMGADTMFIRQTEVFGRYKHMMMFNYTDPKTHKEFEHYFNDDIRYYPAEMNPEVWKVGERLLAGWFNHEERNWAWGQLIHNYQFWSQGLSVADVLDPKMAWQAFSLSIDSGREWNGIDINQANILHFHGSRDSDSRVSVMTNLARQLGLL